MVVVEARRVETEAPEDAAEATKVVVPAVVDVVEVLRVPDKGESGGPEGGVGGPKGSVGGPDRGETAYTKSLFPVPTRGVARGDMGTAPASTSSSLDSVRVASAFVRFARLNFGD
jgi:hypothetical protein